MSDPSTFTGATLLSWVQTEVDYALKHVRDSIAKFLATPEDVAVLEVCPIQLHQVGGALRIVGLRGATRFCEAIESSFSPLGRGDRLSTAAVGVIDRAVVALREFVYDLTYGEANAPMRLYPVYRELAKLQGKSDVSEKDLFFPDLASKSPLHPYPRVIGQAGLPRYLEAQRTEFQRSLVAWLKNPESGLQEIRQALDALDQIAPQLPEPWSLWWAAVGLVDGLASAPTPDLRDDAKAIFSRLDSRMRELAAGKRSTHEPLLREVLYVLAKCKPATARIKEVRRLFKLDSFFPEADLTGLMEYDMEVLEPVLNDLLSRVGALKAVWLQYVSGEAKTAVRFRELVAAIKAKATELGNRNMVKLLDAIELVSKRLPDPYPQQNQFMIIEMASAFLLLEGVINNYFSLPPDVERQIEIMGGWLLDAAKGRSSGEPPAGLRADLTQQINALQLRAQVAKEILANLRHVERVLDAFARDTGKRGTLPGLAPYLRQIHGALVILGFERAAELLTISGKMIKKCATAEPGQALELMDWVAEGLSSLGIFLDPCLQGREPAKKALEIFLERLEQRDAAAARSSNAPEQWAMSTVVDLRAAVARTPEKPAAETALPDLDRTPGAAPLPGPEISGASAESQPTSSALESSPAASTTPQPQVGPELVSIYLEEAVEVLAQIDAALPLCRKPPRDREALTTIRRGFHTLKGSGRMVGLTELGEVAWEIEQVMNRWLEQHQPVTSALLELITLASESFAGWVHKLYIGETPIIDARHTVDCARRLKSGEGPAAPPPADAAPALTVVPPEPVPDRAAAPVPESEVAIGGRRLPRSFFEIYLGEAAQHVAALEAEYNGWCNTPDAEVSQEFLRAAHTLASSSRTAGFTAIADLASAVEHWTPLARQVTEERDVEAVQAAIEKLREMVDAVAQGQPPTPVEEVARRLHELTARLQVQTAPPLPLESKPAAAGAGAVPATPASLAPAPEPVPAPRGKNLRKLRDDIDEQLLPIFLEEAQELLPLIGSDLREWKANPGDERISQSLRRALHTLKGSARMAGAIRLGELTHLMESRIEAAIKADQLPAQAFEELEFRMDRLSLELDRMQEDQAAFRIPSAEPIAAPPGEVPPGAAPRAEPPLPSPATILRINADTLDHLINASGEVSIARSRVEAELRAVKRSLADLDESISRLRGQLREVEIQADSQLRSRASLVDQHNRDFDPLEFDRYTRLQELTRMMGESLHDATSIQQGLRENLGETESALLQQARINRDVQQELMRMRAVPFSTLNERLYRTVRQVARDLGKRVELEIEGGQVELDRGVLERVGAPIEHMLRNALAHGLESPGARVAAGKPEAGRIAINLRQESNEVALILSDDGAGLDLDALRAKALEKGILRRDQELPDADLAQLVFAGLSTAEEVTELSGRGVGMDVVRSDIAALGGRVDVATARGKGTTFTLYLPLTLAVTQAVLVRAGENVLAISSAMVEQVLRFKADQMPGLYERKVVESHNRSYPLHGLHYLLGGAEGNAFQSYNSVLLLRSGAQRIALHVDELLGNQEIVVKNIGPQLARVPGVAGATVLADGRIALIVNPVQLAQRPARAAAQQPVAPVAAAARRAGPLIMVVDDSLTVRKVTSRLLEREGYRVLTAKDGVDALEQIRDALPDVMLVDIEMPRMDGFDLARAVRREPRTRDIPLIIISSRTAEKHRNQAAQIGVSAFLGKPFQESDLLEHIARFIASGNPAPGLH